MTRAWFKLSAVGAALCFSATAAANGGHFLVDDAYTVDVGSCQAENWVSRQGSGSNFNVLPACEVFAGIEVSMPIRYLTSRGKIASLGFEAKRTIGSGLGGDWAISAGVEGNMLNESWASAFVNVPYSVALGSRFSMHLNAGAEYDRPADEWNPTWGTALTFHNTASNDLIVEAAATRGESVTARFGSRWQLRRIDLDASIARDFENKENLFIIGFNFVF
ncbi:MAG: hypothetical protein JJU10_06405 [Idiomarina sp.]|nr:hypothetical protein [Idiomarina sp.]